MDIERLKERMESAEEKVHKCEATIEFHKKQLEKKINIAKKVGVENPLTNTRRNYDGGRDPEKCWALCDVEHKLEDIKNAEKNLDIAKETFQKYKEKYNIEVNKKQYIMQNCPRIIMDFLDQWEQQCHDFYMERYEQYPEKKQSLKQMQKEFIKSYFEDKQEIYEMLKKPYDEEINAYEPYSFQHKQTDHYRQTEEYRWFASLKEKGLTDQCIKHTLKTFMTDVGMAMLNSTQPEKTLNHILKLEKDNKLYMLLTKVSGITGEITDASNLKIGLKGDLNGIIKGKDGECNITTIGAGGYNIQCYHYRVLVKEIKSKANVKSQQLGRRGKCR